MFKPEEIHLNNIPKYINSLRNNLEAIEKVYYNEAISDDQKRIDIAKIFND